MILGVRQIAVLDQLQLALVIPSALNRWLVAATAHELKTDLSAIGSQNLRFEMEDASATAQKASKQVERAVLARRHQLPGHTGPEEALTSQAYSPLDAGNVAGRNVLAMVLTTQTHSSLTADTLAKHTVLVMAKAL